jgi:hypothetical protein
MGQHAVQVSAHSFPKLALRAGLNERQADLAEGATILEQEYRQDGDNDQQPGFFGCLGSADSGPLGESDEISPIAVQKSLGLMNGGGAPTALLSNGHGDVSGADLIEQLRHGFAQTLSLVADARAHEKEESHQQNHKEKIDDAHRRGAAVGPSLDP